MVRQRWALHSRAWLAADPFAEVELLELLLRHAEVADNIREAVEDERLEEAELAVFEALDEEHVDAQLLHRELQHPRVRVEPLLLWRAERLRLRGKEGRAKA